MDKRVREQQTMEEMIKIYCHGLHHTKKGTLCPVCTSLLQYTRERIARCPHMETKTFCAFCKTHCYSPTRREEIRAVMRYSGPRMMLTAPVATLHHLYLSILHKLKGSKHKY